MRAIIVGPSTNTVTQQRSFIDTGLGQKASVKYMQLRSLLTTAVI